MKKGLKAPTHCPNCHERFVSQKDKTYKFCVVHQNSICPFRFEAAAHTPEQLNKNIRRILHDYKLIIDPMFDPLLRNEIAKKEIKKLLNFKK